jgi:hypothetical protein
LAIERNFPNNDTARLKSLINGMDSEFLFDSAMMSADLQIDTVYTKEMSEDDAIDWLSELWELEINKSV